MIGEKKYPNNLNWHNLKKFGCVQLTISIESKCQRKINEIIHKPLKRDTIPHILSQKNTSTILLPRPIRTGFPRGSNEVSSQTSL